MLNIVNRIKGYIVGQRILSWTAGSTIPGMESVESSSYLGEVTSPPSLIVSLIGRLHTVHDQINQVLYNLGFTSVDMLTLCPDHLIRLRC